MRPPDTARSPESRLISVVLPAPFGPSTACTLPRSSASTTSRTAASPPKRRDNASVRNTTSFIAGTADQRPAEASRDAGEPAGQQQHEQDDRRAEKKLPAHRHRLEHFLQRDE